MNFGEALEALRAGQSVTRPVWGQSRYLVLVPGSTITVSEGRPLGDALPALVGRAVQYEPHIDVVDFAGHVAVWMPTHADLLAADWDRWEA